VDVERIPIEGATFSSAVAVSGPGRTVYVSGKTAEGPDLVTQTELIFDQIAGDLQRVGYTNTIPLQIEPFERATGFCAPHGRIEVGSSGEAPGH
jgi:enamine deaminase RidA (YjgF/YER057c/UK114 family)